MRKGKLRLESRLERGTDYTGMKKDDDNDDNENDDHREVSKANKLCMKRLDLRRAKTETACGWRIRNVVKTSNHSLLYELGSE